MTAKEYRSPRTRLGWWWSEHSPWRPAWRRIAGYDLYLNRKDGRGISGVDLFRLQDRSRGTRDEQIDLAWYRVQAGQ